MKKIAILMVLMMGLLALAGCSSDNTSKMLTYNLKTIVEDVDGDLASGVEVTVAGDKDNRTKTTDANGIVQFEDLVSDSYNINAKYGLYIGAGTATIDGRDAVTRVQLSDKNYLYTADSGSNYKVIDWTNGATIINEISEGSYNNIYEVSSGSVGWSSLAFSELSDTYVSDYESITFKVKSNDLVSVIVSIGSANNILTIENGTDLGNGWYELTVPFSEFTDPQLDSTQIGFLADAACISDGEFGEGETFYITDVYLTVDGSNSGSDDEDPAEASPIKVNGVGNSGSTSDTVSVNWGAWAAGVPEGDLNGDGWDESLTKYQVVYSTDSSENPDDLSPIDVSVNNDGIPGFPVKILDGTATAETDYFVWVRAVNSAGNGPWSDMATITTPAEIADNAPTTVPTAPSLDSADVISLYNSSGVYTNINVSEWNPNWGQAGSLTDYDTGAGIVKKLDLQNYQGVAFETIDITGKSTLHISYYTTNATVMDVTAIDGGTEIPHTTETLKKDEWSVLEIDFSDIEDLTNVYQLKFDVQANGNPCQIYMDNIYFY